MRGDLRFELSAAEEGDFVNFALHPASASVEGRNRIGSAPSDALPESHGLARTQVGHTKIDCRASMG